MKSSALPICLLFGLSVLPSSVNSQSEMKRLAVPMPRGIVRVEALDIVEDWTPPVVHLKGNVN